MGTGAEDVKKKALFGRLGGGKEPVRQVSEAYTEAEDVPSDSEAAGAAVKQDYVRKESNFFQFDKRKQKKENPGTDTSKALAAPAPKASKNREPVMDIMGQPTILMTPYGVDWSLDIVGLPQNAIRKEIDDLYTLFTVLAARHQKLTHADFETLLQWLNMSRSFVEKYFNILEILIFPWLERDSRPLVGDLSRQNRMQTKDAVFSQLQKVYEVPKTAKKVPSRDLPKLLPNLRTSIDKLVAQLMNVFSIIEQVVPKILKERYSPKQARNMHRDLIDAFHTAPYKKEHVVLLAFWMNPLQIQTYKQWKSSNIKGAKAAGFAEWEALLVRNHIQIVTKFQSRVYKQ